MTNSTTHRAYLIADTNINKDEEIFCHYGFVYWFMLECSRIGFLEEEAIESGNYDDNYTKYPGFIAYVNTFYPDNIGIETFRENGDIVCYINLPENKHLNFSLVDIRNLFHRIDTDTVDKFLLNS